MTEILLIRTLNQNFILFWITPLILFYKISRPIKDKNENLVPQDVPQFVFNAVSRDIENFQEGQLVLDPPRKTHVADLQQ